MEDCSQTEAEYAGRRKGRQTETDRIRMTDRWGDERECGEGKGMPYSRAFVNHRGR